MVNQDFRIKISYRSKEKEKEKEKENTRDRSVPEGSDNKNACQLQINTSSVTYELHHSVFLVDFLSHPPSLLRISVTSAIKESSNGRTIRIRLTTTIFSGSH